MNARVRPQLLAPESDAVQQHHHRVEGVESLPRIRGRMRLTPAERDVDVLARKEGALGVRRRRGMEQQRGVHPVEEPVIQHVLLARAAFLGRRPEEHDLGGQSIGDSSEPDRSGDP